MASLLAKLQTKDEELRVVQEYTALAVNPLLQRPWVADSALLQSVSLTPFVDNCVPHKLGRTIQGWSVVRRRARAGGYDEAHHLLGATGEPALLNSWVAYGSGALAPAFYATPDGRCHLEGRVKNGSSLGAVQFTVPAQFRPTNGLAFAVNSENVFGEIVIANSTGNVVAQAGTTSGINWDGVSWRVATPFHSGANIWDRNADIGISEKLRADFLILRASAGCTIDIVVW